jgi:SAM-dependent methyltransferase
MTQQAALPNVHIAIMQPVGYVHSLCFLDPARYLRYQLRRFGVEVTMSKNRLRADAINLVFGAHLGFPPEWRERHACMFVNLEQLGSGGAKVSKEYLQLLKTSGVVDYDAGNVGAYAVDASDVPIISFRHAPYLNQVADASPALQSRPIDLLFFGSMNERRAEIIRRIEATGRKVTTFKHALYAEERDHYIRQAKAVLNCHFYESATFEQVRAFHCLSLGTPFISERSAQTKPDPVYDETVFWFNDASLEDFFTKQFDTPLFFRTAQEKQLIWRAQDPVEGYADLMAFCAGYVQGHEQKKPTGPWQPTKINLGSGKDYKPGWLNLDVVDRAEPDLVLDLGTPQTFPIETLTQFNCPVVLKEGSIESVYANNVLEHVPDLPCLMTNILKLLKEGGEIEIEVPYEKSLTAWQDPTHVRAMNENSWTYYTDWFWYLGWFEYRLEMKNSSWLDINLKPCGKSDASFMKLTFTKIRTSEADRCAARIMQCDLHIPDDTNF